MSRVLVIGSEAPVSHEIGVALSAADVPLEHSVGHADTLQRLRMRSFGVVITSPDSAVEEDLALLEEMRSIRPGIKCIVLARQPMARRHTSAISQTRLGVSPSKLSPPDSRTSPGLCEGVECSTA